MPLRRIRRATGILGLALALVGLITPSLSAHTARDALSDADDAYRSARFADCADAYAAALEFSFDPTVAYNAACCSALAGQADRAFGFLRRAVGAGFQDTELLESDSDLVALRSDSRWSDVREAATRNAASSRRQWSGEAFRTSYLPQLSSEVRVAGLSRLWSEAKFNFVNFDLVPELDWDSLYVATIPDVLAAGSTGEYYRVLQRTIAHLRDGHTNVSMPKEARSGFEARPALRLRLVEGRVLIDRVFDPSLGTLGTHGNGGTGGAREAAAAGGSAASIATVAAGDEIVAVDGVPVHRYAADHVRPFVAASTPQDLDTRTYSSTLLQGPVSDPVRVTVRTTAGAERDVELPRVSPEDYREFVPRPDPFQWQWLDGKIAHIRLNTFATQETADRFLEEFAELAEADGWILDVRENGGGNSAVGWTILACLAAEDTPTALWHTREYRPAFRAWGRAEGRHVSNPQTIGPDLERTYRGPVAVLTSSRTYSAAEDFVLSFDLMNRGETIGEATGGSTGQPLSIALPGGGSARICTKRDRYPDGTEFVGVGLPPDIEVRPTVADHRGGVDTVLRAAVRHLEGE